uniref:Uncharacterized protein n=1 Tax=Steinernema glaseri TaxID=37863 RepID=A0A1I7YQG1_9BILA
MWTQHITRKAPKKKKDIGDRAEESGGESGRCYLTVNRSILSDWDLVYCSGSEREIGETPLSLNTKDGF